MQKPRKSKLLDDAKLRRRGQCLKLIGSFLLLASFISQNFFYDRWDSRQKFLVDSTQKGILLNDSGNMNELLYMDTRPTGDASFDQQIKLIKLRKAAEAYAAAESITLTLANVTDRTDFDRLRQGAQGVSDYQSYVAYKRSFNGMEKAAHSSVMQEIPELGLKRRRMQLVYLVFYTLGGIFALIGEYEIYRSGN
jgi:hypothetical protein